MFSELFTTNYKLKNIDFDDADYILEEYSDEDILNYDVRLHFEEYDDCPITTAIDAEDYEIDFYVVEEPDDYHKWIIQNNTEKVGSLTLSYYEEDKEVVEIGWRMLANYRNKGIMTECVERVIKYAKDELKAKTIRAAISDANIPSIKLAERFNFTKTEEKYPVKVNNVECLECVYELKI